MYPFELSTWFKLSSLVLERGTSIFKGSVTLEEAKNAKELLQKGRGNEEGAECKTKRGSSQTVVVKNKVVSELGGCSHELNQ